MSDAMTDTDALVERYECVGGGLGSYCQGCYHMEKDAYGDWVRFEDYERLQGELAVERGRTTYTVAQLDPLFGEGNNKPVEALVRGVVKALSKAEGERDRLRLEATRLREALGEYGQCRRDCAAWEYCDVMKADINSGECNCGYIAALDGQKGEG